MSDTPVKIESTIFEDFPFKRGELTINLTQVTVDESDQKFPFDTILIVDKSGSMNSAMPLSPLLNLATTSWLMLKEK
jgi:hypothetical protein